MTGMTDSKAADVLAAHNEWRRGGDDPATVAATLGLALDHAIARLREPAGVDGIRRYLAARDAKPMRGTDTEVIHAIHVGTEWEAELRVSDLRAAIAPQPPAEAQAQGGGEPVACKDIPDWAIARSYRKHVDALDPQFHIPSALIFTSDVTVEAARMARSAPPSAPVGVEGFDVWWMRTNGTPIAGSVAENAARAAWQAALAQQPAAVDEACGDACAHIAIERDMLKANTEALQAEVAKQSAYAKRTHDWNTELLANNERLAEALRVIEGFTMSQFPDAADMAGACVETAHNALHPTEAADRE